MMSITVLMPQANQAKVHRASQAKDREMDITMVAMMFPHLRLEKDQMMASPERVHLANQAKGAMEHTTDTMRLHTAAHTRLLMTQQHL